MSAGAAWVLSCCTVNIGTLVRVFHFIFVSGGWESSLLLLLFFPQIFSDSNLGALTPLSLLFNAKVERAHM